MRAALAAVLLPVVFCGSMSGQEPVERSGSVREQARVERVILDAYVTDSRGDALRDLRAGDFRVSVDGSEAAVETAEWMSAESAEGPPSFSEGAPGSQAPAIQFAPGRLLIFFFQTDLAVPSRLRGSMRMAIQARRLLNTLVPTDRVAVLSFDSHLKLRQDFTADRHRIELAIDGAIRTGAPPEIENGPAPSLARHFDFRSARRAVTPERALELISRAAEPIAGAKSLLFFGWGLGTIGGLGGPGIRDRLDYRAALPALASARVSIFTLDVTDADYHSLESSLQQISDLTGGRYEKTNLFPNLAIDRVRRAIEGHYVLVLRRSAGPRGTHRVSVRLAHRTGRVLAREFFSD
jgi:VWFA-related protein